MSECNHTSSFGYDSYGVYCHECDARWVRVGGRVQGLRSEVERLTRELAAMLAAQKELETRTRERDKAEKWAKHRLTENQELRRELNEVRRQLGLYRGAGLSTIRATIEREMLEQAAQLLPDSGPLAKYRAAIRSLATPEAPTRSSHAHQDKEPGA
jgi:hypothetical protein